MTTYHGKNAAVYLAGASGAAVLISESAEWSLDIAHDTDPDPAFGDTWETKLGGLFRFSGAINGNFDTAAAGVTIFDSATTGTSRAMYLYPDRSVTANYYYGNVWPKLGIGMPIGRATFAITFDGDGQLYRQA